MANYTKGAARKLSNSMGRETRRQKQHATEHEARMAKRQALTRMPLTAEEKARWEPMLHDTWQAIGNDIEQAFADGQSGKLTRAVIVEVVCDANYLEMYGNMTHDEYEFLGVVYRRPAVQKWLKTVLNY